jgi:hypothetical protein
MLRRLTDICFVEKIVELVGLPLADGYRLPSSKSSYSLIDFFDSYSLNNPPA